MKVQFLDWEIPWKKAWQPTSIFLPGKSHGWRSLAGYSSQDHKELDKTEVSVINTALLLYNSSDSKFIFKQTNLVYIFIHNWYAEKDFTFIWNFLFMKIPP